MTNRGMIGHIGLTNEGLFSSTCADCGCNIYGNSGYEGYELRNFNVPLTPIYNGQAPNDKRMNVYYPAYCNYFVIKRES